MAKGDGRQRHQHGPQGEGSKDRPGSRGEDDERPSLRGDSAPGASQGLAPHPGQIASTYRRRFEELKLRFIDEGSTILVGEADA
jgi:hypothetical protein